MWSNVKIKVIKDFLHKIKIVRIRSFRYVLHIFVSVAIVRKERSVIWSYLAGLRFYTGRNITGESLKHVTI